MFFSKNEKEERVEDLKKQIKMLEKEKRDVKNELEDFKSKKQREEETLKHLIKIEKEKNKIELEKEKLDMERKYIKEATEELTKHHDKIVKLLKDNSKEINDMIYKEIIKRLPNVNYNIEEKRRKK